MIDKIVNLVATYAGKERSMGVRIASLVAGVFVFFVLVPIILWVPAHFVSTQFSILVSSFIELPLGITFILLGLFFLFWSVSTFWIIGSGTPVPFASPTRLITEGPFKYTRNPIKLGAILFYFGTGTIVDTLFTGITMLVIAGTFGTIYHKTIEEKELVIRFGREYEEYRLRTSFLIPLPPKKV
jgi:protein-S-isoprenylcysteine O-methyltransferase Ste14